MPSFGYVGGVTIGERLEIAGVTPSNGTWQLPVAQQPVTATLVVTTALGKETCGQLGATVCPKPETARVRMHVSALLNLTTVIPIETRSAVTIEAKRESQTMRRDLDLPPLAAGRHCLLVAVVEEPKDAVLLGGPHHDAATVFVLRVGSSPRDHCVASKRVVKGDTEGFAAPGGSGCAEPVISERSDVLRLRRLAANGASHWLFAPVCSSSSALLLLRDGVPVLDGGPIEPARIQRSASRVVRFGELTLPSGGWNLLVVHDGTRPTVQISQPVLVRVAG